MVARAMIVPVNGQAIVEKSELAAIAGLAFAGQNVGIDVL